MHCAFGVNLLHTSNIRRSCDHVYSGPAGRSQFLFIVKGVSNESRCLLIEFTDRASEYAEMTLLSCRMGCLPGRLIRPITHAGRKAMRQTHDSDDSSLYCDWSLARSIETW
jgi:hypothetical protein